MASTTMATAATTELVNMSPSTTATTTNHNTAMGGDIEIGLPSKFQNPPITPSSSSNSSSGGKGFLKPLPETTLLERVAGFVAVIAIGTALAAAIIEQSIIVIVGAILSSIIGPYCYYQQTKLTDIRTLQETKTAITEEVNQLSELNQRLIQNITNLTSSVDRLEEIEQALNVLTNTQGQSIDAFQKQVIDFLTSAVVAGVEVLDVADGTADSYVFVLSGTGLCGRSGYTCSNDGTKTASYRRLGWYSLLFHGMIAVDDRLSSLIDGSINSPVYLYRCIPFSTFIRGAVVAVKKYRESGDQLCTVTGVSDFNAFCTLA